MFKRARHKIALLAPAAFLVAWGLPGAAHAQAPKAVQGEIVVRFPASYSDDQIAKAIKDAGCTIKKVIPFSFHYYVLVAPSTSRATSRAETLPAGVTPEVNAAVKALTANNGVLANPNWLMKLAGVGSAYNPKPLVPLQTTTAPAKETSAKTRQTSGLPTLTPNDPLYSRQKWDMEMINMPLAWAIQGASPKRVVRVAVSDSGFKIDHPDFATEDGTSLFINPANVTVDPVTTDVSETNAQAVSHGTHVTGTIAATANNGKGVVGVAGLRGTGIDIRIVPIKITDDGSITSAAGIAAVNYATQLKVDVHNMSWGGGDPDFVGQSAIDDAIAAGVVMVAAAGNAASTERFYPASSSGVISVTSVGPSRVLANYSNYGVGVDIAAPGGEDDFNGPDAVWSTADPISPFAQFLDGSYYEGLQGTSMASPHVAGAAALLVGMGVPHSQVQQALVRSAQPVPGETPVYDGETFSKYGGGILDVYNALLPYADPPFSITLVGGLDLGQSYSPTQPPLTVQAIGVTKAPATGTIVLEVQTATYPATVIRRYVEGTDFTIPRTLGSGQRKSTQFTISVPGNNATIELPPGRYKYVLKVGETVVGQMFTEVLSRVQPQGRSLFTSPFLTRSVNAAQPEQTLFGFSPNFQLKRFDPFQLAGTDDLHWLFQSASGGTRDARASFDVRLPSATGVNNGGPLAYQLSDPTTSVAPAGIGYWLDIDQSTTLNLVGPTTTDTVGVQLSSANGGWNMIGDPFTGTASWAGCAVLYNGQLYSLGDAINAGYIGNAIVGYSGGDYVYSVFPFGTMQPFNGYYVHALVNCTLVIPPAGTTRAAGLKPTAVNSVAASSRATAPLVASNVPGESGLPKVDGWRGRLIAHVAGDKDGQNYFGQSRSVKAGSASQDIPKPPSGAGHAYVRFVKGTGSRAANLAFDMRPLSTSQPEEWTAIVSTDRSNADVTLTWDTLMGLPRASRLTLTDTSTGKTVDMRTRSSYTFRSGEAGASREVKISVAPGTSRGILAITGVTVVPKGRAAGGGVSVRYATTDDADVTAVVKSLTGKEVGQFTGRSRAAAGVANTLNWDGRMKDGSPVAPGAYVITIQARGANGQSATYSQPMQSLQ